ncbi:hypothetical protein LZ30DRAFT_119880 [Colletotrichum cereale]|nr:hypothetical protein LZ30DRAFT_119880 [Colletotrichum cereale]
MIAPNEASDAPAAPEPRTPASTPQSPGTATPAHQCRNCCVSFCQPLGCGHVYCNECLGPSHNLAPGNTGCPECDREKATHPKPLTPEPKVEHEPDHELRERYLKRTRRLSWILLAMIALNMVLSVLLLYTGAGLASTVSRLGCAQLT